MIRRAALLLAGLALALPAQAQRAADTLRVAWRDAVANVDPYYNTQRNGIILADLAWDGPLYRDPASGAITGGLTESWRWVDDTSIELTLRPGVTFQNGDPLGADDVVYTVNTLLGDRKVATPSLYTFLREAERIDGRTVRLHLKRVYPPAPNILAAILPIWPQAYRERVGAEAYAKAPIGTGPYRILPITGPAEILLERFDGHYAGSPKGKPAIRRIAIHQVSDSAGEMAELLGGKADWISDFPADQFDPVSRMPNLRAVRAEVQRLTYLNMDAAGRSGADNPMTKLRVRQAVAHAIDRETIARQFMPGGSRVPDIACFPGEFGCEAGSALRYGYDPAKARALLAEAGYPDGVDVELITYLPGAWVGAIQNYLAAVGIRARTQVVQASAAIAMAQQGRLQMAFAGWGGFAVNDVSAFLNYFYTKGSFAMAYDDGLTALVEQAGRTTDAAARRTAYAEAFRVISSQAYILPLFTYVKTYGFSRQLAFMPFADDNPRFYRARWE